MNNPDTLNDQDETLQTLRYGVTYVVDLLNRARRDKKLQVVAHYSEILHKRISPRFMWAKRIGFESHQNFVQDLEQVISVWQNEGLDGLPGLIFYSMLYATLRSMSTNVTPEVLRVMASLGQKERAVAYAETILDPYQKALAYQILAGGGKKAKEKEETGRVQRKLNRELMQRAFSESFRIENGYDKTQFLSTLAPDLARTGDMKAALSCAEQIDQNEPYNLRDKTLESISVELALAGKTGEAFRVYEQLEEGYSKREMLKDLVAALAKARLAKDALNLVLNVEENERVVDSMARVWQVRRDWLQNVINLARETQDIEERIRFISTVASKIDDLQQEIVLEGKSRPDAYETAKASKNRALLLIWLGKYDDALNILKTLDILKTTDFNMLFILGTEYAFDVYLKGLLTLGRFEDAEYLIDARWVDSSYSDKLPIWADIFANLGSLIKAGKLDEVFAAINVIEPKRYQADAMLLVGPQLARLGKTEDIINFFEKDKYDDHFETLAHQLAIYLARSGMFSEAELLMEKFADDSARFNISFEVAGALIGTERHTEIVPLIKRHVRKISERLELIAYVAEKLAPEDRTTALEILELGLIDSEDVEITFEDRADIFACAAALLTQTGHVEKAAEIAKHLAREKPDIYSEIISESVAKSPNNGQAQSLLTEVLEFVESIPDDPDQTLYLERQTVLNYLVGALASRNQFEHAIAVISRMDDNFWQKPLAFAELAGRLAAIDKKRAETFLNHAIEIVRKRGGARGKESSGYNSSLLMPNILPLFLAPAKAQLAKWIMLSPKVGPLGGLVEIEEGTGMSFIAVELLKAGWVEKALEITKTLKVESIRLQIRTFAAMLIADQGNSDEAHKLLDGSNNANSSIDHLKALGYETSDPKMILRTAEFQRLVGAGDMNGAQNIAKELIDNASANDRGKVFGALAIALSVNGLAGETLDLLRSIPNELGDKIQVQIACIEYFLNEKNYSVAEKVADTVEDVSWKTMFRTLIEIREDGSGDQEQSRRNLVRFINSATEIEQLTESGAIKSWLSKEAASGLIMLGEMEEVLAIVYGIPNLDFRYRTMSEVSAKLVKRGLIEDAHQIFRKIGDQKIRDATVTLIVSEFADLDPKEAIHGFHTFLHDLIDGGFKSTCHAISEIIPLIVKLAGPDHGTELIWETYKEILRVDSFWEQKAV